MITRESVDGIACYSKKTTLISKALLNYAKSKIYNLNDAEDVVQNTLLILFKKQNSFDPNKSFYNWAFAICGFQIKRYLTNCKRNREDSCDYIDETNYEERDSPLKKILFKEVLFNELNNIKLLKSKLPPRESQVFSHIIDGFSRLESRKILGMKESNFNIAYYRAIKSSKKIINELNNEA